MLLPTTQKIKLCGQYRVSFYCKLFLVNKLIILVLKKINIPHFLQMIERLLTHVDNCYYIPNIQVKGYLCKTNMPSNTAFRGFGAPQAMLAAETMIRNVADVLGKTYEEVVHTNLYREGNLTHFNQMLTYCTISRCWKECIENSNYWQRKQLVDDYNR